MDRIHFGCFMVYRKDEMPFRLSGFRSGRVRRFVRLLPQVLIVGAMPIAASAPSNAAESYT